ncbi:hypothetical protein JCM10212_002295 [Sporobolomyces blumeae]
MNRDLLKSRLGKFPHLPALAPRDYAAGLNEDEDDEAQEALDEFPTELPNTSRSRNVRRGPESRTRSRSRMDLSPLSAQGYFEQALEVDVPVSNLYASTSHANEARTDDEATAKFRVYWTPPRLTTTDPAADGDVDGDDDGASPDDREVLFVFVHGAGYSGLSFAVLAKRLIEQERDGRGSSEGKRGRVGVLAYDARGHGRTQVPPSSVDPDEQPSMDLGSLAQDLIDLLRSMFPDRRQAPSLVLVGHSMGGAVVAEACNRIQGSVADVLGVTVIDVVEGTALEALGSMSNLIKSQPRTFESVEAAIGWHIDSRTINNVESARISVPPLVKPLRSSSGTSRVMPDSEEEEVEHEYGWRVDLLKTEPFWRGWFTGLSAKFLGCKTAKLLILAGTDRLDKDLLIGQMQGKYQLEVFPEAGHCVHEDLPDRTAETLLEFWERNDRVDVLKGVKKVGEV